jgi:hypothetical protein
MVKGKSRKKSQYVFDKGLPPGDHSNRVNARQLVFYMPKDTFNQLYKIAHNRPETEKAMCKWAIVDCMGEKDYKKKDWGLYHTNDTLRVSDRDKIPNKIMVLIYTIYPDYDNENEAYRLPAYVLVQGWVTREEFIEASYLEAIQKTPYWHMDAADLHPMVELSPSIVKLYEALERV